MAATNSPVLCLAICAVLGLYPCLCPAQCADKQSEAVSIDIGNMVDGGDQPFWALSDAAARNPNAKQVRVTWDYIVGSLSSQYTALYDRQAHTVKYYGFGGHNMGGNPAQTVHDHCLYTNVTEQSLRNASKWEKDTCFRRVPKILPPYPNALALVGHEQGGFDSLPVFGCHWHNLP